MPEAADLSAAMSSGFDELAELGAGGWGPVLLVGLVLLFFGRRVFWLALAVVGFLAGWRLVAGLAGEIPPAALIVLSVLAGLAGLVLALAAPKLAAGVGGLALGVLTGAKLLVLVPDPAPVWGVALPLAVGVLGAWLGLALLGTALRLVTAGVGAALVAGIVPGPPLVDLVLFGTLWIVGFVAQRTDD